MNPTVLLSLTVTFTPAELGIPADTIREILVMLPLVLKEL